MGKGRGGKGGRRRGEGKGKGGEGREGNRREGNGRERVSSQNKKPPIGFPEDREVNISASITRLRRKWIRDSSAKKKGAESRE